MIESPTQQAVSPTGAVPLVVDLDGTLTRSDTLYESFLLLLKRAPHLALLVPLWLLKGKANLKAELARRVELDPGDLPYCQPLIDHLKAEKQAGRRLVLATAADERIAQAVAGHLGLFELVLASDGRTNLSGAAKLTRIRELVGPHFDYAGNAEEDLHLWKEARASLLVNASRGVTRRCQSLGRPHQTFSNARPGLRAVVKMLRVHQWAKNVLVLVPLVAAHRLLEPALLLQAVLALAAFSLCASSVYILNDLLDLPADRRHPTKRRRPFAAGDLPVLFGLALWPVLMAAAFALSLWTLPLAFSAVLGVYWLITLAYSLYLKQVMALDVLVLAGLYTIRMVGGTAATEVPISNWLLSFSTFLFFSLALIKRLSELRRLKEKPQQTRAPGRGYDAGDYDAVGQLGSAAGLMSVLVLALYIQSGDVGALYGRPDRLLLMLPMLLYWLARFWVLAHRGQVNDDPLVHALKDPASYAVAAAALAVLLWAS